MSAASECLFDWLDRGAEWLLRHTLTIQYSRWPFVGAGGPVVPAGASASASLGEDIHVPEDMVMIVVVLLVLAAIHAVLHHFVFTKLAVYFCVLPPAGDKDTDGAPLSSSSSTATATTTSKKSTSTARQRHTAASSTAAKGTIDAGTDDTSAALDLTRQKFATTCWKLLIYSALFVMGCYALLADNAIYRLQHGGGRGWIERGFIANYQDWPDLRLRNITFVDTNEEVVREYMQMSQPDFLADAGDRLSDAVSGVYSYAVHTAHSLWQSVLGSGGDGVESLSAGGGKPGGGGVKGALFGLISASPILWHYYFALGHYFYSTLMLFTNVEGPKQKDKVQMLTHHIVTILLVFFSWYSKLFRSGTYVLILHDLSDPFMETAKLMLYSGRQTLANIWFAAFALVFIVSRCVVFPMALAWPTIRFLISEEGQRKAAEIPFWYAPAMGLCLLQCLHIFWSGLIINMVMDALTKGDVGEDIRDESIE